MQNSPVSPRLNPSGSPVQQTSLPGVRYFRPTDSEQVEGSSSISYAAADGTIMIVKKVGQNNFQVLNSNNFNNTTSLSNMKSTRGGEVNNNTSKLKTLLAEVDCCKQFVRGELTSRIESLKTSLKNTSLVNNNINNSSSNSNLNTNSIFSSEGFGVSEADLKDVSGGVSSASDVQKEINSLFGTSNRFQFSDALKQVAFDTDLIRGAELLLTSDNINIGKMLLTEESDSACDNQKSNSTSNKQSPSSGNSNSDSNLMRGPESTTTDLSSAHDFEPTTTKLSDFIAVNNPAQEETEVVKAASPSDPTPKVNKSSLIIDNSSSAESSTSSLSTSIICKSSLVNSTTTSTSISKVGVIESESNLNTNNTGSNLTKNNNGSGNSSGDNNNTNTSAATANQNAVSSTSSPGSSDLDLCGSPAAHEIDNIDVSKFNGIVYSSATEDHSEHHSNFVILLPGAGKISGANRSFSKFLNEIYYNYYYVY